VKRKGGRGTSKEKEGVDKEKVSTQLETRILDAVRRNAKKDGRTTLGNLARSRREDKNPHYGPAD